MEYIKMYSNGITVNVPEPDVAFYKRAGYVVVKEEPIAPKAEPKSKAKKAEPEAEPKAEAE